VGIALYDDLQGVNVSCFFCSEEPEDRFGDQGVTGAGDTSARSAPVDYIQNSISSTWVEREVETAVEREKIENRVVLFPTTIDDSVLVSKKGWAEPTAPKAHRRLSPVAR
jgi:hypothetical protein